MENSTINRTLDLSTRTLMTAKEAVDHLVLQGYVALNKSNKLIFTKKYYEDHQQLPEGAVTAIAVKENKVSLLSGHVDWDTYYMQFIIESEVPRTGRNAGGGVYDMNKFSKEGCDAFRKAIMNGIKYEGLVACTKLYYKSKVEMKMAIGKYIAGGAWRTDYLALGTALQDGKIQQHIKETTTDATTRTSYRVG